MLFLSIFLMENSNNQNKSCCENKEKVEKKGIWSGIVYGIMPHIGCIAFIVFTIFGVTAATTLFKPLLLNPYFFYILIVLSLVFATISAFVYLKKQGICVCQKTENGTTLTFSTEGIKRKWKYLSTLYGTTVFTNLLLFMVIFPITANLSFGPSITGAFVGSQPSITLKVDIPCPGHAPLITDELKKIDGVNGVKFRFPNLFDVTFNPAKTTKQQILSLDVFNTYKATVTDESSNQITNPQSANNSVGGDCGAGCGGGCGCGARR